MKYILILLISFTFAQVIAPIGMGEEKDTFYDDVNIERYLDTGFPVDTILTIETKPLSDLEFYSLEPECYEIVLDFQDGWEAVFDNDSICPETIDVRVKVGDKTIEYTVEEFMERLGFIEQLKETK